MGRGVLILFGVVTGICLFLCGCSDRSVHDTGKAALSLRNANCYFFFIADCPACRANFTKFTELRNRYESAGVHFTAVYAERSADSAELNKMIADYKFDVPVVYDTNMVMAKKMNVTVTPQFVLADSAGGIHYSGLLDNFFYSLGKHRNVVTERYLEDAIVSLQRGEEPKILQTIPIGCKINFNINK